MWFTLEVTHRLTQSKLKACSLNGALSAVFGLYSMSKLSWPTSQRTWHARFLLTSSTMPLLWEDCCCASRILSGPSQSRLCLPRPMVKMMASLLWKITLQVLKSTRGAHQGLENSISSIECLSVNPCWCTQQQPHCALKVTYLGRESVKRLRLALSSAWPENLGLSRIQPSTRTEWQTLAYFSDGHVIWDSDWEIRRVRQESEHEIRLG